MSSDPELTELRERLSKMSDDELIRMVCEEYNDYREEALRIAEAELAQRGIYLEDADVPSAGVGSTPMAGDSAVRVSNRTTLYCSTCSGELRSGYLFAQKEIVILFSDNNEERFLDVLACKQCGRVQLMVDYETDVEGSGV